MRFVTSGMSIVLLAACSAAGGTPSPTPAALASGPAVTPTPLATGAPTSVPAGAADAVVVTFETSDGARFKVELTQATDIATARAILAGTRGPAIPSGRIVRGSPGVNVGYSWHLDPASFEFADLTMEMCDGLPRDVEAGTLSGDRYCPWTAKVVAIDG